MVGEIILHPFMGPGLNSSTGRLGILIQVTTSKNCMDEDFVHCEKFVMMGHYADFVPF